MQPEQRLIPACSISILRQIHFDSSKVSKNSNKNIKTIPQNWKYSHLYHTLMLIFDAAIRFGTEIGDGHEIRTRTDDFTTFGRLMSSNASALFDCFRNIFIVAMYSLRNEACWAALCKFDGRNRYAKAVTASSTFLRVIACLLSV